MKPSWEEHEDLQGDVVDLFILEGSKKDLLWGCPS
jgi:hypothetical protein